MVFIISFPPRAAHLNRQNITASLALPQNIGRRFGFISAGCLFAGANGGSL
jgi:hypothetical protein